MHRLCTTITGAVLMVSCLLCGCGDGAPTTASADELRQAQEAAKGWEAKHSKPAAASARRASPKTMTTPGGMKKNVY